jgi:hypothetical protein
VSQPRSYPAILVALAGTKPNIARSFLVANLVPGGVYKMSNGSGFMSHICMME